MRFLLAGLAMLVATSVAAHDETSTHSHDSIAPGDDASIVDKRVHRFKQSGAAIQSVFKEHLGADDFPAIAEAATLIADWADVMPDYFPTGSTSPGVRDEIWTDFDDSFFMNCFGFLRMFDYRIEKGEHVFVRFNAYLERFFSHL